MKLTYPHHQAAFKTLWPLYLITGDEKLFQQETLEALKFHLKKQGFDEWIRIDIDTDPTATQWLSQTSHRSIFCAKQCFIMDCRSFTEAIRQSLEQYLTRTHTQDCTLIMLAPKLEKRQLESKWYTRMEPAICHIIIWPLDTQSFPIWVKARAHHLGIKLQPEAITYLCERSFHNTFVTQQELEKLSLSFQGQTVTLTDLENTIAESSRYDVYELTDAVLLGDLKTAHRILHSLDAQKTERFSVLLALVYTLKQVLQLHELIPELSPAQAFKKCGIWTKKEPFYQAALKRLSPEKIERLLMQASACERVQKGLRFDPCPDQYLERWVYDCCSLRL